MHKTSNWYIISGKQIPRKCKSWISWKETPPPPPSPSLMDTREFGLRILLVRPYFQDEGGSGTVDIPVEEDPWGLPIGICVPNACADTAGGRQHIQGTCTVDIFLSDQTKTRPFNLNRPSRLQTTKARMVWPVSFIEKHCNDVSSHACKHCNDVSSHACTVA